jgi:sulfonate transport system substrate-binding protein
MLVIHRAARTASAALVLLVAACGTATGATSPSAGVELRLGYLTNLTHATALVGVSRGYFADRLRAAGNTLKTTTFNAGPDEVEALLSNSIDAAFVGPIPAVTAYTRSHGAVRVVAGAALGGAGLVVRQSIGGPADLRGKTLATPELGNTQDVALRYWLRQAGLSTNTTGGGDVHIAPQENAQTLQTFKAGQIDGAWVPEPWLTRLQVEAGGKLLVDERTLWPGGRFTTTLLLVRTDFLRQHPTAVTALLQGETAANSFLEASPAAAQQAANDALATLTRKSLSAAALAGSWSDLSFTDDPDAASVAVAAEHAHALGLVSSPADLRPMFDLTLLDQVLRAAGRQPVSGT